MTAFCSCLDQDILGRMCSGLLEVESDSPAELEEDFLKDQNWTSAAQYGERLTSKQRVGHACQRRPKQGLYGTLPEREGWRSSLIHLFTAHYHQSASYYISSGGFSQKTSKCYDWGHAGAVQEKDRRQTLQATSISDVTPQEGSFPPNVIHQTTKNPDRQKNGEFSYNSFSFNTLFLLAFKF